MSTTAEALAFIDSFDKANPDKKAWVIPRDATLARLRDLVRKPDILNQRGLSACAPAAFFRIWLERDPLAAATFGCDMLAFGSAKIGSKSVSPGWKLLGQDYNALKQASNAKYPNSTPETADWMLLAALRDSENAWFTYNGEPDNDKAAGVTLPSTVVDWLKATNLYSSVVDDTKLVLTPDGKALLNAIPGGGRDVLLLIDAGIIDLWPQFPANQQPPAKLSLPLPNHYIVLTAPVQLSGDKKWLNWVEFWTWGARKKGWVGADKFASGYYGLITATA